MNVDTKINDNKNIVSPMSPPRESVILNVNAEDISRDSGLCCGYKIDNRLLSFTVKVGISLMVLGFSMYKLYKQIPCQCDDDSVVYVSLITSILSVWTGATLAR